MAFVAGAGACRRRTRSARGCVVCCVDARRRDLLRFAGLLPVIAVLPAQADRTGKFSTKLTAARRYIPRIKSFRDSLKELKADVDAQNFAAIVTFTGKDGPGEDVRNPLELFASSFFSEGNRASSNTELKPTIDSLLDGLKAMQKAAKKKDGSALQKSFNNVVSSLNEYIDVVRSVKAFGNDLEPLTF
eukprot:Plantae.Rhodophyta-Purpureofilum_apyrenoidigerum.ctg28983.p2 GENE.Plantae.Rhodophyta-Purpureofilum_apyrenoidigerum.ctg28983~~Plantae.Rhodophyta-Purpureofilum_apyrenoidigerum.ctg28983.p2  ORF type:complete len:188 (-),score=33.34 Plantae.Rhodophyta-Purpureofilum_apyrenoidigerum.ctg28983:106-669(-)